jgi:putative ABC transport system permease protein
MLQDFRYAARLVRRSPGFSATVVTTLALGVGLTTSIFSIVYGVLLRPLPYANPSALVTSRSVSADAWAAWKVRTTALEDIGLYDFGPAPLLLAGEEPVQLRQALVSANLLSVLGVRPVIGRGFRPEDSERGAEPVAMLTYRVWQESFGARPDAIGTVAPFEPVGRRVIGVLPADFVFPMRFYASAGEVRVLTPMVMPLRQGDTASLVARLEPGATLVQARAEEIAIAGASARAAGTTPASTLIPLDEALLGGSRPSLLLLFGAVGFLFLIACANVGNLLLAKGLDARREFAIRSALGASRGRLAVQVIAQSCTLSVTGGLLGVLLAYWSFDALMSLVPSQLPRVSAISIDNHVVAFAFLLSLITGAMLGLLPAWSLARGDAQAAMQSRERATPGGKRIRLTLLAAEIALAVVLLSGAALFVHSFVRLLAVDLGFAPRNVLTLRIRTLQARYPTVERQRAFLETALERIGALPGVSHVGAVEALPLTRARRGGSVTAVDGPTADSIDTEPRVVSPGYFDALGIDIVLGRSFSQDDVSEAPLVAVINETLARRLWPGSNPLGWRIRPPAGAGSVISYEHQEEREVVGVVGDVRLYAVDTKPEPQVYIPYTQSWLVPPQLVIRTIGDPAALAPAVRRELRALDSAAAVEAIEPLTAHVAASIAQPRFQTWLLLLFGGSGLLLAAVGVGGVVAYAVSQRTREIGIRMALGARGRDIARAVTAASMVAVGIGLSVGLAGALALGRLARGFLFEIGPYDPLALSVVVVVLAVTALTAAWLPARRAQRVDPLVALRAE